MPIRKNTQAKRNASKADAHNTIYEMVTMRILNEMSNGKIPWRDIIINKKGQKPAYTNFVTGKPYSFLNCLLLGEPGEYASFKQIKERGGVIKKGAKGRFVIFWGEFVPKENKEKVEELEKEGKDASHLKVKFPKYYTVFNINDTEGVRRADPEEVQEEKTMEEAEAPTATARMVREYYEYSQQVRVLEDTSSVGTYLPDTDEVAVQPKENFEYEEDWFASVFSGLVHSTATEERCNRENELKKMREGETSVKEELIGEIGSSMILTACGLQRKETHEQLAATCQKWIEQFKNDYRLIVTSSYAAEKAAKLILGEFAA